jgi:acyl carrier protein
LTTAFGRRPQPCKPKLPVGAQKPFSIGAIAMIHDQVVTILRTIKQTDHVEVSQDTNLIADLGFTSMDVMNLILELEQHFSITFLDRDLDLDHFITLGAVLDTLKSYDIV